MKDKHARGGIPPGFLAQLDMLDKIIVYKSTLPLINWVGAFETAKSFTLSGIHGHGVTAKAFNTVKNNEYAQYLSDIENRDTILDILMENMMGGMQVLKAANSTNYPELLFWGAVITVDGKMTYPTDAPGKITMLKAYYDKWFTYGAGLSPIEFYNVKHSIVMSTDNTNRLAAKAFDDSAAANLATSVTNTELRNNEWETPLKQLVMLYNMAKATFVDYERELNLMGFILVESHPTYHLQKSSALQMSQTLVHGAIIGSVMENNEDFDIIINPGEVLGGTPIIFHAHTSMAVVKGMSSFIMENPDALKIAHIKVWVRRSR